MTDPFYAIADPTRRAILDLLRGGDAPAGEIAAGFAISRPAVSKHLRVLREARLVRERRARDDARQRVYTLTAGPIRAVADWARTYEAFWPANLAGLKRHLEAAPSRRSRAPRDAHS